METLPERRGELIQPPNETKHASTLWTKGLGSLLLSESESDGHSNRDGAIRLIAINPTLRAECECLLPVLDRAKQPATDEEIITAIGRAMPAWGVTAKHAAEWGVTFASYAKALEGLPLRCIEEGIVRWNRGEGHKDLAMGGFPPRPAQLYVLANEARRELVMAAYRAKLAVEYVEAKAPRQISDEERKLIRDGLNDLVRKFRAKPMVDAPAPSMSREEMADRLRSMAKSPIMADAIGDVV